MPRIDLVMLLSSSALGCHDDRPSLYVKQHPVGEGRRENRGDFTSHAHSDVPAAWAGLHPFPEHQGDGIARLQGAGRGLVAVGVRASGETHGQGPAVRAEDDCRAPAADAFPAGWFPHLTAVDGGTPSPSARPGTGPTGVQPGWCRGVPTTWARGPRGRQPRPPAPRGLGLPAGHPRP
jgi:hypothetical protein